MSNFFRLIYTDRKISLCVQFYWSVLHVYCPTLNKFDTVYSYSTLLWTQDWLVTSLGQIAIMLIIYLLIQIGKYCFVVNPTDPAVLEDYCSRLNTFYSCAAFILLLYLISSCIDSNGLDYTLHRLVAFIPVSYLLYIPSCTLWQLWIEALSTYLYLIIYQS